MGSAKANFYGNPYVGLYTVANDSICLTARNTSEKNMRLLEKSLEADIKKASINNTGLLGIYVVMNKNGIIVPSLTSDKELEVFDSLGLNVYITEEKLNASGNNISVNDKGGIINKEISVAERKKMSECLGVELIPMDIQGYSVVGSVCSATNKGFIAHNNITENEMKKLESIFKVKGINSTANLGSYFVGISMVANSKGCVVGNLTTGVELQRIQEGLDLL